MNKLIDFTNCEEIKTNGYDETNGTNTNEIRKEVNI